MTGDPRFSEFKDQRADAQPLTIARNEMQSVMSPQDFPALAVVVFAQGFVCRPFSVTIPA